MDRSLYVAMTGAAQTMLAQAVHANNLANVSTNGFKADYAQARAMQVFGDTYPSRVYAMAEIPATNTSVGSMNVTGNPLDIAVQGGGWIAVQAPDGQEAYTRAGDLSVGGDGLLRNGAGFAVMGNGGPINVPAAARAEIGEDGSVTVQALGAQTNQLQTVDRIKLVKLDEKQMYKGVDGLMHLKGDTKAPDRDPAVRVVKGSIETSNVSAVAEMTSVIELSRQFEMQVKFMQNAQNNDESMARILQVT